MKSKKTILFLIENVSLKEKIINLINKCEKYFNVITTNDIDTICHMYDHIDYYFPQQSFRRTFCKDEKTYNKLLSDKKIVLINYYLSTCFSDLYKNEVYRNSYINCIDCKDILKYGKNFYLTGHPYSESLRLSKEHFYNPWPINNKKNIMICTHWTFAGMRGTGKNYSNFLEYYDSLIEMILKYRKYVNFVFRPHPALYKMYTNKKISTYLLEDTKENRKKLNLIIKYIDYIKKIIPIDTESDVLNYFKHSDAMMHDCGSFRCEYLYMNKPLAYFCNEINTDTSNLTSMGKDAMDCHVHMYNKLDIENFIESVLSENDIMKLKRLRYFSNYINTEYNKNPSQNIIDKLL